MVGLDVVALLLLLLVVRRRETLLLLLAVRSEDGRDCSESWRWVGRVADVGWRRWRWWRRWEGDGFLLSSELVGRAPFGKTEKEREGRERWLERRRNETGSRVRRRRGKGRKGRTNSSGFIGSGTDQNHLCSRASRADILLAGFRVRSLSMRSAKSDPLLEGAVKKKDGWSVSLRRTRRTANEESSRSDSPTELVDNMAFLGVRRKTERALAASPLVPVREVAVRR